MWLLAGDDRYTYGAALTQVLKAAASLRAAGVAKGDRVVVTARNTAEYFFTWLAIMEAGGIQVPVNPEGTEDELAGFVAQGRAQAGRVRRQRGGPVRRRGGARRSWARRPSSPATWRS